MGNVFAKLFPQQLPPTQKAPVEEQQNELTDEQYVMTKRFVEFVKGVERPFTLQEWNIIDGCFPEGVFDGLMDEREANIEKTVRAGALATREFPDRHRAQSPPQFRG